VGDLVKRAADAAELQLAAALPRRWTHVKAVAHKAEQVARVLNEPDARTLVAAAWLHDVGYAPQLALTGLHALDGGRWLVREGFPERVATLVAYHSCAAFEAQERGLADELAAEFTPEESPTADALWFVDMTTGPDGQDLDVVDRLSEARTRYGPDHLVTRFWDRAEPTLLEAVHRFQARLAASQPM
jgi:putative nucleotidyltransferase with HDIG domain